MIHGFILLSMATFAASFVGPFQHCSTAQPLYHQSSLITDPPTKSNVDDVTAKVSSQEQKYPHTNLSKGTASLLSTSSRNQTPSSRILKSVRPFGLSAAEAEYLTGVSLRINHYVGLNTFAFTGIGKLSDSSTSLLDKLSQARQRAIRAPKILSKLNSPRGTRVTEGIQTVDSSGKQVLQDATIQAVVERIAYLVLEDLDNVRRGIYPIPSELGFNRQTSLEALGLATKEFMDLYTFATQDSYSGAADYSTNGHEASHYARQLADGLDNLPDYYINDFHSVPGGFMAPEHVMVYDQLSEVAFLGTHLMARRMMLPPIAEAIQKTDRSKRSYRLLDVGTGTGSFIPQVKEAFPNNLELSGIDLSPAMIAHAKRICHKTGVAANLQQANMENIPEEDESFDFVTHSNCFHEMPEYAVRNAAKEFARVLKPGGLVIHNDAVQMVDDPSIAKLARPTFDKHFNEPFMNNWQNNVDLDQIMTSVGLFPKQAPKPLYASCLRVYQKASSSV